VPSQLAAIPRDVPVDEPVQPSRLPVTPRDATAGVDQYRLVIATLALCVICILAKGVLLPIPGQTQGELARWLIRLAIVASADMTFVVLLAACCGLVRRGIGDRPLLIPIWRFATVGLYGLVAAYAVVSIALLRLMMVPLTLELLSFAGGPRLMASSIRELITPGLLAGLAASLVTIVLSFRWGERVPNLLHGRLEFLGAVWRRWLTVATLAALFGAIGQTYIGRAWTDPNRWERRISASPHATFLGSVVAHLIEPQPSVASWSPDDADTSDFLPREATVPRTSPLDANRPTNVLVVVLESVGVEYLSLYGASHETMPRLAQLARERGIVFENVYAHAPSSPKGLIALTASVYPRIDWKLITRDCPDFDVPNLAQVLHADGYRTAYLHSGYWSWKLRDRYLAARGVQAVLDADSIPGEEIFSWGIGDQLMFQAALDWIDQAPRQAFHAMLWTIETHHPYIADTASPRFDVADTELSRYLSAIESADRRIGWLYEQLVARGLDQNTLVVVTGDHGEVFGQHNQRVHSFGVYDENVRVPLVMIHPKLREGDRRERVTPVCQQIDIAPTILGLLGEASPASWQGGDLFRAGALPRAYFYSVSNEVQLGVREDQWKYIYRLQSGHEELYDLSDDPNELHNLAPLDPQRTADLRRRVAGLLHSQRAFLAEHGAP